MYRTFFHMGRLKSIVRLDITTAGCCRRGGCLGRRCGRLGGSGGRGGSPLGRGSGWSGSPLGGNSRSLGGSSGRRTRGRGCCGSCGCNCSRSRFRHRRLTVRYRFRLCLPAIRGLRRNSCSGCSSACILSRVGRFRSPDIVTGTKAQQQQQNDGNIICLFHGSSLMFLM